MAAFHFLRPEWLLALPLFWLACWWHLRGRGRGGTWSRVVDPELLPFMVDAGTGGGGRARSGGLALAGTLAVLALAGPTWERAPVPVFRKDSALVIALDLSASMNAEDVTPSRLVRARYKVADLLRLRRDGQSGLVVFAAQSFVVTPLTDDTATLLAQLQGLDTSIMPRQGSAPESALAQAAELLEQAGITVGHVLLVTDGADAAGLARAGAVAESAGLAVSVLGVGTEQGAPVPDASGGFMRDAGGELVMSAVDRGRLAEFAAAHDGLYLDLASEDAALERLNRHIEDALAARSERLDDLASSQWREAGPWLLLPLLVLAALGFRRGAFFALALAVLPLAPGPVRAQAAETAETAARPGAWFGADWFRTDDQAGAQAFERGDYATAAERFANPEWRAAARYRAGDYEQALETYAEGEDALAHYNRGNALARLGRYEEALAAYERALEAAPGNADAEHNKAVIEELLAQQNEQQPPQQGSSDDEQREQDEQQGQQQGENQAGGEGGTQQQPDQAEREQSEGEASGEPGEEQSEQAEAAQKNEQDAEREAEQQQARPEQGEEDEENAEAARQLADAQSESDAERAQATEQWLRQIPDDPAGLLRRKFQYQYKQRYGDTPYEGDRW
ncbi:MAG: VWA domain-containing protein [Gammaproteobacteria bacterium]